MESSHTDHTSPSTALIVSATDSGGCSGMQADLRVCGSLRVFAVCAVTAVTAQNSQGVKGGMEVPPELLRDQIRCAFAQHRPAAVKVGLLPSEVSVEAVFSTLGELDAANIILDPVMCATSGPLMRGGSEAWCDAIRRHLRQTTLVTPNIPEFSRLSGRTASSPGEIRKAARELATSTEACAILVKGGHTDSDTCTDILFQADSGKVKSFTSRKVQTCNLRGTGCTLSTAIACYIARGYELQEAVLKAHTYLQEAIRSACDVRYLGGAGPVDHFAHIH